MGFARRLVAGGQGATLRDACRDGGVRGPGRLLEGAHDSGIITPESSHDPGDGHARMRL